MNKNIKLPTSTLRKVCSNLDDYYLIRFKFKYAKCAMYCYLIQLFKHMNLQIEKIDGYNYVNVDTRSLEYAYIDWLRRNHGQEMLKVWKWKHIWYHSFPHIDGLNEVILNSIKFEESIYLKEVCNYYNHWPVNEKIIDEILMLHSVITTELYMGGYKKFIHKAEGELFKMVKNKYPDAVFQYRSYWLGRQSLDIYIPSLKIGIEYQGQQHYIPYNNSETAIKNQKDMEVRDEHKKRICEHHYVRLLFWEYNVEVNNENFEAFMMNVE